MSATAAPLGRPTIVVITGAPGSGKSILGAELARALRVPFLARDDVRGGQFFTGGAWSADPGPAPPADAASEAFLQVLEGLMDLGVSCVAEYVLRRDRPEDLQRLAAVAECRVIHLSCQNASKRLAQRSWDDRLLNRHAVLAALGFADIEAHTADAVARAALVAEEMMTTFDVPTMAVATDTGYDPDLEAIIAFATQQPDSPAVATEPQTSY